MKVAIVYDRLNKIGGAEQILACFHELFPEADWYTSVWDPARTPFTAGWRVYTSWLNRLPYLRTHHELIPFLMPFVFEAFDFTGYDLVISVGSAESKGVITRPETLHLNYCLTPTRYLYSHKQEYLSNSLYRAIAKLLRRWDQVAATRPDLMISISEHVKNRVKKYYERESDVIYPPVDTKKFTNKSQQGQYFLVVARLVPYKRIDLIVRAFNQNKKPLIIVGTGSELPKLKKLAKKNIRFVGLVSNEQLLDYYAGCRAFIQANVEDFGIAMVEALAAGKPVIAYQGGGALEILNHKTGMLYYELSPSSLNTAIIKFEKSTIPAAACREQAEKFDKANWKLRIKKRIIEEWQKHQRLYG